VRVVTCLLLTLALVAATPSGIRGSGDPPVRHLDRATFEDKVRGGWAGQMVGVSFGAPTEFHSNGKIIEGDLPEWAPDHVSNAIDQDDLYVEMTFAAVMDRVGLQATTEQFGEALKTSKYELWHANAGARRLLNLGIPAPLSGDPRYNPHANDIDFQIEADFIGLMTPGLPRAARDFSLRVGRVMNSGDGLYGGIFITSMYAAAFFDSDPRRVVEAGLAALPPKSSYAAVIRDVLAWHTAHPDDWKSAWLMLEQKWDKDDACPDGSLQPFNIDAKLNGAYVALGLLYGGGDFSKTLEVATRAGQDSDCNPSSAGGILGVMLGYAKLPDQWKGGIPALAGQKFSYTDYSFDDIVQSTLRRAEKVIVAAGGTVDAGGLTIPVQVPDPPPLQQWDMGIPEAIVPASGSRRPSAGRKDDRRGRRLGDPVVHRHGAGAPRRVLTGRRPGYCISRRRARTADRRVDPGADARRRVVACVWAEARRAHIADCGRGGRRPAIDRPRDSTPVSGRVPPVGRAVGRGFSLASSWGRAAALQQFVIIRRHS
jgi:hypothetical protein